MGLNTYSTLMESNKGFLFQNKNVIEDHSFLNKNFGQGPKDKKEQIYELFPTLVMTRGPDVYRFALQEECLTLNDDLMTNWP